MTASTAAPRGALRRRAPGTKALRSGARATARRGARVGSSRARGHLLAEALFAGALVLLVITATASALVQSSRDAAIARDDQQAYALAETELEVLRALPLTDPRWTAAVTGPTALPTPGWASTITVADLPDPALPGVALKHAIVVVAYKGRTARVETYRWNPPPP